MNTVSGGYSPLGIYIINHGKTWENLQLVVKFIVAIENSQDIIAKSARPYDQRVVLNEPHLLILTNTRTDHQPVKVASLGNIPTIAFCDIDSPMGYVDIGIPTNNKGKHSIGCLFWLLAMLVLQMQGTIPQRLKWDAMVDMFFCKELEEAKQQKEEETVPVVDYYGAPSKTPISSRLRKTVMWKCIIRSILDPPKPI
ncbi:hypothetical protein K2173_018194 [Erythroxylum novogranatense]|uniref:40S ribosomal protein SA n=1 Tax=Erythroxylum novogranatense TaxID=1862640 RepID=A0AAV8TL68_9ROSI|nr:hypothetical protein K2173_018194 [Erythroxylum novogranatense]